MITVTDLDLPERIASRINEAGGLPIDPSRPVKGECWLWTGGTYPSGYGSCWMDGANRGVHQVVFEAATGLRSDRERFIDHLCRNRPCCNPGHLELTTPLGNMLSAQRDSCRNGHEFTEANTAHPKGSPHQRVCRACSAAKQRAYRARKAVA